MTPVNEFRHLVTVALVVGLCVFGCAEFLLGSPQQSGQGLERVAGSRAAEERSAQISVMGSSCSEEGIRKAISTVAASGGGVVNVYCPGTYNIGSNLWSGIEAPTKVVFGPGTFVVSAQQSLPDNTEVAGSGFGTVFRTEANATFDTPFDSGLFTNVLNNGLHNKSKNSGISLHDFKIDGSNNRHNVAGVSFYNVERSSIHDLYIRATWLSGIDLRNASDLDVRDNWCVDCAMHGDPQHAIGGGVNAKDDVFIYNKFTRNHMSGGGGNATRGADQFDIFGQGMGGNQRCGFNVITDNTSDSAPTVGIFLDNCSHNTVTGNVVRNAGLIGIACTSGVFNLDGGCAFNNFSNQIQSPGKQGYLFYFTYENVVTGGEIYGAGEEAILLNDSIRTKVEGVSIYAPSQADPRKYCAVTINADQGHGYSMDNTIQNNTLSDKDIRGEYQNKMKTGVCITHAEKASAANIRSNVIEHNRINGGDAGSYNDGLYDMGMYTLAFCNAYGGDGTGFKCEVEHK
jgi:parallel beta-helix repeat protein